MSEISGSGLSADKATTGRLITSSKTAITNKIRLLKKFLPNISDPVVTQWDI